MVILPLLLWAAMLWFDRWQTKRGKRPDKRLPLHKGWLLALAYIGCLSHPLFDWFNSYGIRLLEPFSSEWFYGDTLFIIDPWIWIVLIVSVWISLRRERRGQMNWTRPAWVGFTAICAYIFVNGAITGQAEQLVLQHLRQRHDATVSMPDPVVVANPVPFMFWRREILWRDADREMARAFGQGTYSAIDGLEMDKGEQPTLLGDPRYIKAIKSQKFAPELRFWSRMPKVEFFPRDGHIFMIFSDQRFSEPLVRSRFAETIMVRPNDEPLPTKAKP